jgi:hypothetical protein
VEHLAVIWLVEVNCLNIICLFVRQGHGNHRKAKHILWNVDELLIIITSFIYNFINKTFFGGGVKGNREESRQYMVLNLIHIHRQNMFYNMLHTGYEANHSARSQNASFFHVNRYINLKRCLKRSTIWMFCQYYTMQYTNTSFVHLWRFSRQ